MKAHRRLLFFVVVVICAVAASSLAGSSRATGPETAAVYWSSVAEPVISAGRPPASSQVLSGLVHAAIYDSVAAAEGGLEPFLVSPTAADGALPEAAVAKAARDVLVARVPAQAGTVEAAYTAYINGIPDSQAKADGIAAGTAVAAETLALRAGDNFDNAVPYVQAPPGPGVFEPIAQTPVVDVKLKQVIPFTFSSPSDFRPNAPVSLRSGEYGSSFDEVKAYGGTNPDTLRTEAQTDTVRFYTDQAYVQWSRALRGVANGAGLDLRDSARLLGLVHVAAADTMVACWEAKFHYLFWRPFHAIRRADTDGNHKTSPDPNWMHLVTGNHPEYPSGHACITSAYTEGLQTYFHTDRLPLVIESTVFPIGDTRRTRSYERLSDVREDVADARVWGGLHFRSTMEETPKLGDRIVAHVAAHYFRETRGG
jgi:hypothetical protein